MEKFEGGKDEELLEGVQVPADTTWGLDMLHTCHMGAVGWLGTLTLREHGQLVVIFCHSD